MAKIVRSNEALNTEVDLKAPLASPTFTGTVGGITKVMVGLSNVDNTADVNKAVASAVSVTGAQATAITANSAKVSNVTTNLSTTTTATTNTVVSSDGTNAVLPAATTTVAGVMTGTDKLKLNGIELLATADQIASEVPITPVGGIAATTVQAAIEELDNEKQPKDGTLTALAGVTTSADKLIYATGADTFTTTTLTAAGRALIDDASAAAQRTTLGISATNTPSTAIGGIVATNVQAALQELDSEKAPLNSPALVTPTVDGNELSGTNTGDQSASQILTALKTVDGSGSGLDADLLDGQSSAYYATAASVTALAAKDPVLTLTGDVTGSATFTNLGNATLTAVVADDSHNHIIGNVDGLQAALDGKAATSHTHAYDNYGSWTIKDGDTTVYTVTSGDTLQIKAGTGISSNFTADDVLTITNTAPNVVQTTITGNAGSCTVNDYNASASSNANLYGLVWASGNTHYDTTNKFTIQNSTGTINATTFSGALSGNATTATTLQTARTINGVSFNGSANITVADSTKAPLASPALTDNPTAPTATGATNTTQLATTAQVHLAITADVGVANSAVVKTALNASGTAPIYACRAWVNFNGTGTVAIRASGNVSSITDNATGVYAVNFITAMPDVNYCTTVGANQMNTGSAYSALYVTNGINNSTYPQLTTSVKIENRATGGATAVADILLANVSVFR